ncbi:MAG: zinc ribbon domain-containing protein [Ignavibacteria bacterium]|nr:zinc ribbon domain-containing protein [Ignavibacteria bacterium]
MNIKTIKSEDKLKSSMGERDYYNLCPKCGNFSHINENHIHCSLCGTKLIEECPNCKTKIETPTAQFCVKCGERLLSK